MAVEKKSEAVTTKFSPSQVALIREASARDGERTATWLRQIAVREAKQVTTGQRRVA
jgi:uncharacterized protein (DUF1778 family)